MLHTFRHATHVNFVQAIKVRTSPNKVETALLHIAELDASVTDLRLGAIHRRNPLHTFMFNSQGALLNANVSALEAFQQHHAGELHPHFVADCLVAVFRSMSLVTLLFPVQSD